MRNIGLERDTALHPRLRRALSLNAVHEYTHWWDENDFGSERPLKPYPDYYNRTLGWTQFREDWNYKATRD